MTQQISIIAAVAHNRAIGYKQELLCYLPNDLKRFKALTQQHTIVMGRLTYQSLPSGALPNRHNIVITTARDLLLPNTTICHSMAEALAEARGEEVFMIGGASVYGEALPFATRMYLTEIDHTFEAVDTYFPQVDFSQWREVKREEYAADERHPYPYAFVDYERITL